ncbi:STE3-domain-containing protein [Rickenella mellea]|uniref:STE3-domain-containing protein n=1 Tax=Rickenella mellea TaxID=50990 RepID=A0A4Y7PVD5_9AGAM|nr:STE3-domain-containing protein [Rickenella mellea]
MQSMHPAVSVPYYQLQNCYIHQRAKGHRFSIFEDIGCTPAIYNIWPAYPIYFIWPLVCGVISSVYCVLTLKPFSARRSRFDSFYSSGHSSQRYVRLMLLSVTDVAFTIAFSTWVICSNAKEMNPYISWADTHSGFSVIHTFPSMIWRSAHDLRVDVEFDRWNIIMCAIVFIAFFTFAEETRGKYKSVLAKRANLSNRTSKSVFSNNSSRIVFCNHQSMVSIDRGGSQMLRAMVPTRQTTGFLGVRVTVESSSISDFTAKSDCSIPQTDAHEHPRLTPFQLYPDDRTELSRAKVQGATLDAV